jgi:hypothetical protein
MNISLKNKPSYISFTQPDTRPIKKKKWVNLTYWKLMYGDWVFLIKPGFWFDGASIPTFASLLTGVHRAGMAMAFALPHDVPYVLKGKILPYSPLMDVYYKGEKWYGDFTRKELDIIMRHVMEEIKDINGNKIYNDKQICAVYNSVRVFGWIPWNKSIKPEEYYLIDINTL